MKKIFSVFLALLLAFGLAACGEDKEESAPDNIVEIQGEQFELGEAQDYEGIQYKSNSAHLDSYGFESFRSLIYPNGEDIAFSVMIFYDERTNISNMKDAIKSKYGAEAQEKTVNGIDYVYFEYTDVDGYTVHEYDHPYRRGVAYMRFFFGDYDAGNFEEVFMNNVTFKKSGD